MPAALTEPWLLIFDFDGTLYEGVAHLRFYGRTLAQDLPLAVRTGYLAQVEDWLAGRALPVLEDGSHPSLWAVLSDGAKAQGLAEDRIQPALEATRRYMVSPACPLAVPAGLPELLRELRNRAHLVLATNSELAGALPLLQRLQLAGHFERIVGSVGKPEGLAALAQELAQAWQVPWPHVVTVGDNPEHDIQPVLALGGRAILLQPHGTAHVAPDAAPVVVTGLPQAYPILKRWLEGREVA